ncbi:MAG: hypothetical protein C0598_01830 [Marinilabiliales bacterium]|nr:MAG: hypothetical protein C0598_01830 [Marinilabiliales bacterium]
MINGRLQNLIKNLLKLLIMRSLLSILILLIFGVSLNAQQQNFSNKTKIPSIYHNIKYNDKGELVFVNPETGKEVKRIIEEEYVSLVNLRNLFVGTPKGVELDLKNEKINGIVYYGFYAKDGGKFPQPVFFKKHAKLINGVAEIDISKLKGRYDIAKWEENAIAKLGYRIVDDKGNIIYDGKIYVTGTGPFKPALSIVEGPYVNKVGETEATIVFTTNFPSSPYVEVNGRKYEAKNIMGNIMGDIDHEIKIHHLRPDTEYDYTVVFGKIKETYSFKTAPAKGSKSKFTFAYVSDSRQGNGGGERSLHGSNAYIMKKIAAMSIDENASFMQFTGDMINGYSTSLSDHELQFANWRRAIEPYWHYIPVNIGMGNHEAYITKFDDGSEDGISVDNFPFNSSSAERIFANNFVNPENGPLSEDGSKYDPDKNNMDFPPYKENVFYYTYANTAIVVLNSNYLYSPKAYDNPLTGGNAHGYIMDVQLEWLKNTLKMFEKDDEIDHVFVTVHTPALPNGGHANNDMWYFGDNSVRPVIAGVAVDKGIIERRDEFLNLLINKSQKVVALLCGDEHNYSRIQITSGMPMYPENWDGKKLKVNRPFWQITNGSAGAPYYGKEELPWSDYVNKFSTQYALMLFDIEGDTVKMRVKDPDTFDLIEEVVLREE